MKRAHSSKSKRRKAKHSPSAKTQGPGHKLPAGLQASIEREVGFEWTIAAYDPRLPAVLSTPAMIGLMEIAASTAIQPYLPEGVISVGTRIEVDHLKALPQGATVEAQARLAGSQGRFLIFEAEARSGEMVIGRGRVFRAIVPLAKYDNKSSNAS